VSRQYVISTENDADLFPSTGEDVFDSMDKSDTSSESDQEMPFEIEARKRSEAVPKKQSCNRASKPGNHPRKEKAHKKKSNAVSAGSLSILCVLKSCCLLRECL
jgi:hypothetical protein